YAYDPARLARRELRANTRVSCATPRDRTGPPRSSSGPYRPRRRMCLTEARVLLRVLIARPLSGQAPVFDLAAGLERASMRASRPIIPPVHRCAATWGPGLGGLVCQKRPNRAFS